MLNRRELAALLSLPLAAALPRAHAQAPAATVKDLERAARAEGKLASVGMPDDWANWGATWADLKRVYGLDHVDTDMSSAEEIAKIEAEKANATVDIGDVGFEFGAIAKSRGITRAYKPSTWSQVPDWAKDADGHWALAYTGTIAFAVNRRRAAQVPRSWKALFDSSLRVAIGEVGRAAQSNAGVLSAAIALGGDETNLQAALAQFARIAKQRRLITTNPSPALMERAEADVFVLWDFNGLSYRDKIPNVADYEVLIPTDGSVTSGYTTIINANAPHPNAAQLAREYIFSDAGQINLARGNARPIRVDSLKLPDDIQKKLVDSAQYRNARAIKPAVWTNEVKKLPRDWQKDVLGAAS
jgi:putative spermidine/putrescine transport system substrate-binding protein